MILGRDGLRRTKIPAKHRASGEPKARPLSVTVVTASATLSLSVHSESYPHVEALGFALPATDMTLADPPSALRPDPPKLGVERDARAQSVLDAAVAVFSEKGLHTATLQDVADRIGMAKILVYRLYPSRQALIDALFGDVLAEIEGIAQNPWGGYGSGVAALIELGRARPALYLLLLRDARGGAETAPWATACDVLIAGLAQPFIAPPAGASALTRAACAHAARAFLPFIVETWVAGIRGEDGMTDAARVKWFGDMVRAWRTATYEALDLPLAPEPIVLASIPTLRDA
jgi:AcrR family transcriptional regulator